MTVRELLNHFEMYPDAIRFYDEKYNIEDKAVLYDADNGDFLFSVWKGFLNEYGERLVEDWYYCHKDRLDLRIN